MRKTPVLERLIEERCFHFSDQERFAQLSGDLNPMHMDPVAARRTLAGALVVHGMHVLLWALDAIASRFKFGTACRLEAQFTQFVFVGETVALYLTAHTESECRAELRVASAGVVTYALKFGEYEPSGDVVDCTLGLRFEADRAKPLQLEAAELKTAKGVVDYVSTKQEPTVFFPHLSAWIGAERVRSLLALTRLVGMVSPGLYSIFHRVSVKLVHDSVPPGKLAFAAKSFDPRFAVTTMNVRADGIIGQVRASQRQPAVLQLKSAEVKTLVPERCFEGHSALVIGGSRGLGEVTAKMLAAGGASVALTYSSGKEDAEAIVQDIRSQGGTAHAFHFNCLESVEPQLTALRFEPRSVYYFATPRISVRTLPAFSYGRFLIFTRFYVEAFHDLVMALANRSTATLNVLYPSTIYVEEVDRHMSEYAMAKAAGELLCANLSRFSPRISILAERLPRVATDQNNGLIAQDTRSAEVVMAEVVASVEALS